MISGYNASLAKVGRRYRTRYQQLLLQILGKTANFDIFGVHINIRNREALKPDFGFVQKAEGEYPLFLLSSGYIESATDAEKLFEAGVEMVGIAEPTGKDPKYT